jgi:hypothetical protein
VGREERRTDYCTKDATHDQIKYQDSYQACYYNTCSYRCVAHCVFPPLPEKLLQTRAVFTALDRQAPNNQVE